jgi:hypothetical protein
VPALCQPRIASRPRRFRVCGFGLHGCLRNSLATSKISCSPGGEGDRYSSVMVAGWECGAELRELHFQSEPGNEGNSGIVRLFMGGMLRSLLSGSSDILPRCDRVYFPPRRVRYDSGEFGDSSVR